MSSTSATIAEHNADIFDTDDVAKLYNTQELFNVERVMFETFKNAYIGKRLLDLGVGAGRTTQALLPLAGDYVGIDRAKPMLALARKNYPSATFLDMDVRAIDEFGVGRFDFVLGALAILSAFDHPDRINIIRSVHHILAPGGYFAFSFHNRNWKRAGGKPLHARSWHPREIVNSLHPRSWSNYRQLKSSTRETDEYAILVDQAHRWSGLFYFIDLKNQIRQLEEAGFEIVALYGEDGRVINENTDTSRDGLLNLVCRVVEKS